MTRVDFANLNPGDRIRHKHDPRIFVVTANYGNRITAVASVDMTNPIEWERVPAPQCPHGEPIGQCADCVREHQEATR